MRIVTNLLKRVARNAWMHFFLGIVVLASGLADFGMTLLSDLMKGSFHIGHGVVLIGIAHALRALAEIVESFDYLNEAVEEK
jgi:hypothetical protein